MTSREHARLLGLFLWIFVGFQVLMSVISGVIVFVMFGAMSSEFSKMPHRPGEPDPAMIFSMMPIFMIIGFAIGFLFLIPKAVAAYGLRNDKSWAKVWAIVACCLAILSIPIGTALGVYGLWFIFGEQGKNYFSSSNESGDMPPPPPNNWQ